MKRALLFSLAMGALGCGGGAGRGGVASGAADSGATSILAFDPGPVPANGYQIVTPDVTNIEAGGDYEYCTWSDVIIDRDIDLKSLKGFQTTGGHHIVVYYTTTPQPAGTQRICTNTDMESFRFGMAVAGEGANQTVTLPGDLAVHIPMGSQLVLNHHYLNPSAAAISIAKSAVDVFLADPGAKIVASSALSFVNLSLQLPPGPSSAEITCAMDTDYAVWDIKPHMHQWGVHTTVDVTSAANGSTSRLFDVSWAAEYAFNPPTMTMDEASPLVLHRGDTLHMQCDYNNTTGMTLGFGPEMCVTFAQTVDTAGVGNKVCNNMSWFSN